MGPFSVVNPNNGLAFEIEDSTCANGMSLNSAVDDHTNARQRFYLGRHGSIFSAHCPGLVIASNDSGGTSAVKLEVFRINEKKMKWKFSNGTIESVAVEGAALASNPSSNAIILQDKNSTSDSSAHIWVRRNTRLLASNSVQSEWKQKWAVSFITSDYKGPSVQEFVQKSDERSRCYKINSAFSPSFESFARELVVNDASDEKQCSNVREKLGFDKDHPFDVEVKANFDEHKCDPFFTGIDHKSGEDMEALSVS